jgi:hypothetical protein
MVRVKVLQQIRPHPSKQHTQSNIKASILIFLEKPPQKQQQQQQQRKKQDNMDNINHGSDYHDEDNDEESMMSLRIQLLSVGGEFGDSSISSNIDPPSSRLYDGTIPVSKLRPLWKINKSSNNTTKNSTILLIQQLFLRSLPEVETGGGGGAAAAAKINISKNGENDKVSLLSPSPLLPNVHVSYQYQVDPSIIEVVLRQQLVDQDSNMMKIVGTFPLSLQKVPQQSSSLSSSPSQDSSNGGNENYQAVWDYCQTMGNVLNSSLQQLQQWQDKVHFWKHACDELSQSQETIQATWLRNFTNLRNTLVQKHQEEMVQLKASHQAEKEAWKKQQQQQQQQLSSGSTKHKRRFDDFDDTMANNAAPQGQDDDDNMDNECMDHRQALLFDEDLVGKYARKEKITNDDDNSGRQPTLPVKEAVDFVQVRREATAMKEKKRKLTQNK